VSRADTSSRRGTSQCPACGSAEVRWAEQLGSALWAQCRDCGTEYRSSGVPVNDVDAPQELICPGCGLLCEPLDDDAYCCEDCGPSDCAYCGATVYRWELSENLACRVCEQGEVAA
jgi:hypothetical protein